MATMLDGERPAEHYFYGFQPHWLCWDRLYRIYASETTLAGAYISEQLYDEQSPAFVARQKWVFLRPWVRLRLAQRRVREMLYDSIDPFAPSLPDHDKRNFQLKRRDVVWTRLNTDRSWWTPFNVGVLEIGLRDGATLRFVLDGGQEWGEVLQIMERFDPAIEVTGKSRPRPMFRPVAHGGRRSGVAGAAASLLGVGSYQKISRLLGLPPL
jgi:hypothetical protein